MSSQGYYPVGYVSLLRYFILISRFRARSLAHLRKKTVDGGLYKEHRNEGVGTRWHVSFTIRDRWEAGQRYRENQTFVHNVPER